MSDKSYAELEHYYRDAWERLISQMEAGKRLKLVYKNDLGPDYMWPLPSQFVVHVPNKLYGNEKPWAGVNYNHHSYRFELED